MLNIKQIVIGILPVSVFLRLKWWHFKIVYKDNFSTIQEKRKIITTTGYSYKPCDDIKAIFIHIPKCAGVTINKAIFGNLGGGHTTLEEYLVTFEPKCIAEYFKFTIVRNPWDRLVSSYLFLQKGGFGKNDRNWFDQELKSFASFDDFVKNWVTRTNIWKRPHFCPQYQYIYDKRGKISLDFIGFFENIEEDFTYITQRINKKCRLPVLNQTPHSNYMDYYTEETKQIVSAVYSEDIKLLGYNFDNSNLGQQLSRNSEQSIWNK